jgi:LytTr DNA-binding domain
MAMSIGGQVGIAPDHFQGEDQGIGIAAFGGSERTAFHKPEWAGRKKVDPAHSLRLVWGRAMNLIVQPDFSTVAGQPTAGVVETFPGLRPVAKPQSPRIAIKAKGRILFINLGDVMAVVAEGNYVSLKRGASSFLLRETISAVTEKLEPYGFIRIHRSVLVNPVFVEEIQPYATGEYGLRLKGGEQYTVTRTYKKNLHSLAEFWIGVSSFSAER